jgi:hypothetical protein
MSDEKREEEVAPSMNPEKRPDLQDYKSKDKVTPSATGKKSDFTSVTTVPTSEGDVQAETELEIPLENYKENVKSENKPPKVNALSEEEPSFTTVSKKELSERSVEVQHDNTTES